MALLDLLLPPACAACGRFGSPLCAACLAEFRPPSRPDERFVVADAGIVLGEHLELAVAAFAYAGPVRAVLQRVKYTGAARVAGLAGAAALPAFVALLAVAGAAALVPVPLHDARRRERGYNQAALIAASLGRETGLEVRDLLRRERATARQHGLGRAARLQNLAGAFRHVGGAAPPGSVILVDDILTTSATLESCATVLRAAGAEHVYGFAVAKEV